MDSTATNSNNPLFFFSHAQQDIGDFIQLLCRLLLLQHDISTWFDLDYDGNLNSIAMQTGIQNSKYFVLVLTKRYLESWYCGLEITTAIIMGREMILMVETDVVRGGVSLLVDALAKLVNLIKLKCGEYIINGVLASSFPVIQNLTIDSLKNLFGNRTILIERPSINSYVMVEKLLKCIEYEKLQTASLTSENPSYHLLFDTNVAQDQAMVITTSIQLYFGIYGRILLPQSTASELEFNPKIPTLLFVTDDVLAQKHVIEGLEYLIDHNNNHRSRFALIHENDGTRHGRSFGVNDESFWSSILEKSTSQDIVKLMNSYLSSSIAYGKNERSLSFQKSFLMDVLDSIGLLKCPFQVDSLPIDGSEIKTPSLELMKQHSVLSNWCQTIAPNNLTSLKGLLIKIDSETDMDDMRNFLANQPSMIAARSQYVFGEDLQILKSICAQCIKSLYGFIRAFSTSLEEAEKQLSHQTTPEAQAKWLLSKPSKCLVVTKNKSLILIENVTSAEFARALRIAVENMSPQLGLVVVVTGNKSSSIESVVKSLGDFAVYDWNTAKIIKNDHLITSPKNDHNTHFESTNKNKEWDFVISYQPGEGDDAARSLALDLVKFGQNVSVWFDKDRHMATVKTSLMGVHNSRQLISVWTCGMGESILANAELENIAEVEGNIKIFDTDASNGGMKSYDSGALILKRTGEEREKLVLTLLNVLKLPAKHLQDEQTKEQPQLSTQSNISFLKKMFCGCLEKNYSQDTAPLIKNEAPMVDDSYVSKISTGVGFCQPNLCCKPDILITGSITQGMDSMANIQQILYWTGICAVIVTSEEQVNSLQLSSTKALCVYLTRSTLSESHIAPLIMIGRKNNLKIVPVHDADNRNEFSAMNENNVFDYSGLVQGADKIAKSVLDSFSIPHTTIGKKYGTLQCSQFVKDLMERCELANDSLIPSAFHAGEIVIEKAREIEPGTREFIFDGIQKWFDNSTKFSNVFVLLAVAGVGKSCIMAEFCRRGNPALANVLSGSAHSTAPVVGAFHFFQSSDPNHRSLEVALRSVSMQLKATIGSEWKWPDKAELDHAAGDCNKLLEILVLRPAREIKSLPLHPLCIVLDALDECGESSKLVEGIRFAWSTSNSLVPHWLLLVLSSRPEEVVSHQTTDFKPFILQPSSASNASDLSIYLKRRLVMWQVQDVKSVTDAIVEQSEGVFIWIKFQEPKIREFCVRNAGNVTKEQIQLLPQGMKNIYDEYFTALRFGLDNNTPRYRQVVSLGLLVGREPVPENIWKDALGYCNDNGNERFEREIMQATSKLLLFEQSETNPGKRILKPPHKSMLDWLTGDGENSANGMGRELLHVEVRLEDHQAMALACERSYQDYLMNSGGEYRLCTPMTNDEHQFAVQHAAFHEASSNSNNSLKWFNELDRMFHWISGGIHGDDARYLAMLHDGDLMLQKYYYDDTLRDKHGSEPFDRAKLLIDVLRMPYNSLLADARKLPNEILSKVYNTNWIDGTIAQDRIKLRSNAELLAERIRKEEQVGIALPIGGMSGVVETGGALKMMWKGHDSAISSVSYSADGTKIVTGSKDKTIRVWDSSTAKELRVFRGHGDSVKSVCFSPRGREIVSASSDCTIRVWDYDTCRQILVIGGAMNSKVQSEVVEKGVQDRFSIGSETRFSDRFLSNLDETTQILQGFHIESVNSVCVSPDGTLIASGSHDHTVRIWSYSSGAQLELCLGHTDPVYSVCFSPSGNTLASSSFDETVRVWDVISGRQLGLLKGHSHYVACVCYSRDGKYIASASRDKTVVIWNSETGAKLHELVGHLDVVESVCFSPNGTLVISSSWDKTMRVWELTTGTLFKVLEGHLDWVHSVCFSPNSTHIVSVSGDKTVCVWDSSRDIKELRKSSAETSQEVRCMCISRDANFVALGLVNRTVSVWNITSGRELWKLEGHMGEVDSVAFSPDCNFLISGSKDDYEIGIWKTETGCRSNSVKLSSEKDFPTVRHPKSVCFSPDGLQFAFNIGIWVEKKVSYVEEKKRPERPVKDKKRTNPPELKFSVNICDTKLLDAAYSIPQEKLLQMALHHDVVNCICFSLDGTKIASASEDKTLQISNFGGEIKLIWAKRQERSIQTISFSPDGKLVASGSTDTSVCLWNSTNGEKLLTLKQHKYAVIDICFSPSGFSLISSDLSGVTHCWDVRNVHKVLFIDRNAFLSQIVNAESSMSYSFPFPLPIDRDHNYCSLEQNHIGFLIPSGSRRWFVYYNKVARSWVAFGIRENIACIYAIR
jgi:WD40 repeat protein